MDRQSERATQPPRCRCAFLILGLVLGVCGAAGPLAADETNGAKIVSEHGSILIRPSATKAWRVVAADEKLATSELLLGLPGAKIDSADGAVRLTFHTDLLNTSPFPVIESAIVLHPTRGADLDFSLDRGWVDVTNRKSDGAARVRLHVRQETWNLVLDKPETSVTFELYGRWPAGTPFRRDAHAAAGPTADLVMLVTKGQAMLTHAGVAHHLSAPPGPAMIQWDSVTGQDETAHHLDKLPAWVTQDYPDTQDTAARKANLAQFRRLLAEKPPQEVLEEFLNSDDPRRRRLAVFALGALDSLPRLGQALREGKHPDVWENGVLALRHWIGRAPGQDQILYRELTAGRGFTPVDAETVLQLLHSFGEGERAQPETYETLIDFLSHDKLAIRGLAYWHLVRLVPAGKELGYQPFDPKEKREEAIRKWKKLIPSGQLPPGKPGNGR